VSPARERWEEDLGERTSPEGGTFGEGRRGIGLDAMLLQQRPELLLDIGMSCAAPAGLSSS